MNVRSWQWSGTSVQQSVVDHVKTCSQLPQKHQVATEAAAASGHRRPREGPGEIVRDVKGHFFVHRFRLQHGVRRLLFQPSSIDNEASGISDTFFQNVMECDADLHKNLYTNVMLIDGAALFQEIGEYTAEDGT